MVVLGLAFHYRRSGEASSLKKEDFEKGIQQTDNLEYLVPKENLANVEERKLVRTKGKNDKPVDIVQ